MRPEFLLKLAFLNIFTKRLRTALTVGGIGISVGVIVLLLGIGNGLQSLVTTQISKTESQNVVSVTSKRTKQIKIDQVLLSKLKSISGVSGAEQIVNTSGKAVYHGISLDLPVYAVTAGYFDITPLNILQGKTFVAGSESQNPIVISSAALKAFGLGNPADGMNRAVNLQVQIPQDIDTNQTETTRTLAGNDYHVVGIIDKGNAPVVYIPAENLFKQGVNVASEVKLTITVPDKIPAVRESVEQYGLETSSIRDTIDQVNRLFGVIRTVLVIFGLITLAIAVFGTLNTITIELVEQTKQIGFMRVMGIRKQDVGTLFIIESILLSLLGVISGIVVGVFLGVFTNGIVLALSHSNGEVLYLYQVPTLAIVAMVLLAVGLGWVIGVGPARRAVKIDPLEAIRF